MFSFLKTINLISCINYVFRKNYLCYMQYITYVTNNVFDIIDNVQSHKQFQ
jgi:hypothetical protein